MTSLPDYWRPDKGEVSLTEPTPYRETEATLHVGDYDEPAKVLSCAECNGTQFIVGQADSYYTAIKCPTCGWEILIHQG